MPSRDDLTPLQQKLYGGLVGVRANSAENGRVYTKRFATDATDEDFKTVFDCMSDEKGLCRELVRISFEYSAIGDAGVDAFFRSARVGLYPKLEEIILPPTRFDHVGLSVLIDQREFLPCLKRFYVGPKLFSFPLESSTANLDSQIKEIAAEIKTEKPVADAENYFENENSKLTKQRWQPTELFVGAAWDTLNRADPVRGTSRRTSENDSAGLLEDVKKQKLTIDKLNWTIRLRDYDIEVKIQQKRTLEVAQRLIEKANSWNDKPEKGTECGPNKDGDIAFSNWVLGVQIVDTVWKDSTSISQDKNLKSQINKLRKHIRENASELFGIESKGSFKELKYRFWVKTNN